MMIKEIPLSQKKVALVDIEDYKYLNQWKWCVHKNTGGIFYAVKRIKINKKWSHLYMHRDILKPPEDMKIDHIDGNGLNNRKNNLRICTISQNGMNSKKQKNNKSGYKGIRWHKQNKKWEIYVSINKKQKHLGYFNTIKEAISIYNKMAIKYYGEFARLNDFKE